MAHIVMVLQLLELLQAGTRQAKGKGIHLMEIFFLGDYDIPSRNMLLSLIKG